MRMLFVGRGNRVAKADALNKAAIAAGALVSDNDIEKRACLGTAASESKTTMVYPLGDRHALPAMKFKVETRGRPPGQPHFEKPASISSSPMKKIRPAAPPTWPQ